jgi:hypothetical protein
VDPTSGPTATYARSTNGCFEPSPTPTCADGDWRLCECMGWPDNDSYPRLVSWCWSNPDSRHLVVVNLSDASAQARVRLPWEDLRGQIWELTDRLDGQRFQRAGDALADEGLYVALGPWASHFLAFTG